MHRLSLKKPQSVEAWQIKSYLNNHNFWRSNNDRRVKGKNKGNLSKTCERQEETRKKKTTKKE
jgi:hypothetical protein